MWATPCRIGKGLTKASGQFLSHEKACFEVPTPWIDLCLTVPYHCSKLDETASRCLAVLPKHCCVGWKMSSRRRYGRPGRPKEMLTMGASSSKSKVLSLWNPIPSKVARWRNSGKGAWYRTVLSSESWWLFEWQNTKRMLLKAKILTSQQFTKKLPPHKHTDLLACWGMVVGHWLLYHNFPLRRP